MEQELIEEIYFCKSRMKVTSGLLWHGFIIIRTIYNNYFRFDFGSKGFTYEICSSYTKNKHFRFST